MNHVDTLWDRLIPRLNLPTVKPDNPPHPKILTDHTLTLKSLPRRRNETRWHPSSHHLISIKSTSAIGRVGFHTVWIKSSVDPGWCKISKTGGAREHFIAAGEVFPYAMRLVGPGEHLVTAALRPPAVSTSVTCPPLDWLSCFVFF